MFLIRSFYLTRNLHNLHIQNLCFAVLKEYGFVCVCPELLQSVQKQAHLFDSCGSRDTYLVIVAVLQKPKRNFVIGLVTAMLWPYFASCEDGIKEMRNNPPPTLPAPLLHL